MVRVDNGVVLRPEPLKLKRVRVPESKIRVETYTGALMRVKCVPFDHLLHCAADLIQRQVVDSLQPSGWQSRPDGSCQAVPQRIRAPVW